MGSVMILIFSINVWWMLIRNWMFVKKFVFVFSMVVVECDVNLIVRSRYINVLFFVLFMNKLEIFWKIWDIMVKIYGYNK